MTSIAIPKKVGHVEFEIPFFLSLANVQNIFPPNSHRGVRAEWKFKLKIIAQNDTRLLLKEIFRTRMFMNYEITVWFKD